MAKRKRTKRKSLKGLIKRIERGLSSLKRAGGPDFEKGKLGTTLNALQKNVAKLDDEADGCGYTLTGGFD